MLFEKIHLEDNEKIIKIVRRHWFRLFSRSFSVLIIALLPLIGWIIVGNFTDSFSTTLTIDITKYTRYFIYLYMFWLLMSWMSLAYIFTDQYLDLWCITDRRVIAIDQISLFRRQTGSFRLEKLQDMNIEINGIIATMLDYGSIEAQTASESEDEFRANYIPQPRELKAIILKATDRRMKIQNEYTRQDV